VTTKRERRGPYKKSWTPMRRTTADTLLAQVLERVAVVNAPTSPYAYQVASVWVFGSYLKGADRPNDLDIAVQLKARYDDQRQAQTKEERREGCPDHIARVWLDRLSWPETEVQRFLKSGSPRISLHDDDDLAWVIASDQPVKLVYGEKMAVEDLTTLEWKIQIRKKEIAEKRAKEAAEGGATS